MQNQSVGFNHCPVVEATSHINTGKDTIKHMAEEQRLGEENAMWCH